MDELKDDIRRLKSALDAGSSGADMLAAFNEVMFDLDDGDMSDSEIEEAFAEACGGA
jgi:hypothetical protein